MRLLICGDYSPQERVSDSINNRRYGDVLTEVKNVIQRSDYSIVNFESAISDNNDNAINKIGPNLRCTENAIEALKWAGFKAVTLANNHFRDQGNEGVAKTLEACKKYRIDVVGGGRDIDEASRILYVKQEDKVLSIINCCEHEFSIATKKNAGANPLNPVKQYYEIQDAKRKAGYVVVIIHGGHEHYNLPSPQMQDSFRFFIDAGADAVVCHHQHCYSGYEIYHDKPIFYGVGNFCFDPSFRRLEGWYEGYMVMLNLCDKVTFTLYPYSQCKTEGTVNLKNSKEIDSFQKRIIELNTIITDRRLLEDNYRKYQESVMKEYSDVISPFTSLLATILTKRHILPIYYPKKKWTKLLSMLTCDAHRNNFTYYIKKKINM